MYVRFTDESVAAAAKEKLDGMTFDGRKVSAYFFPIADFVNASWRVGLPPFPPPAALYAALALALALAPRLARRRRLWRQSPTEFWTPLQAQAGVLKPAFGC